jgi:histidine triad (HIT) family protein
MDDCVFCLISEKKISGEILYEDDEIVAFKDINPEAPVHILIIPRKHISSLMELSSEDMSITSRVFNVAKKLAEETGISKDGFRIVANTGRNGGQTVNHLHFHLLGGRGFEWPPG